MKKIFVFNMDVGSAIEYAGDIITSWVEELGHTVMVDKVQTEVSYGLELLRDFKPDLVIVNEDHHRPCLMAQFYYHLHGTPYIYIDHAWQRINGWKVGKGNTEAEQIYYMWYGHTLQYAHAIFCLNYKPDKVAWSKMVDYKIHNMFYPTDPDVFNIQKPWSDRSKMFAYFGNLIPHKLSQEFLEKVIHTDIKIDLYGRECLGPGAYGDAFEKAVDSGNLKWYGLLPQDRVAETMNKYKYFVMPHDGYEPFNWVVKQCAYCGTIPLIVNDRNTKRFDPSWIDWADGLYLGCNTVDEFLHNLQRLDRERPDHSAESALVSKQAMDKFNYHEFKNTFQTRVEELLNG